MSSCSRIGSTDAESEDLQPMKLKLNGVPWWKHFHVARMWSQSSLERAVRRSGEGDYYEYLHKEGNPGWSRVLESFDRIRRLAHHVDGGQIPVILMLVPSFRGVANWEDYPYSDLNERLTREGVLRGFTVLDLRRVFERHGITPSSLHEESNLPNEEGQRQIAVAVLKRLVGLYSCLLKR